MNRINQLVAVFILLWATLLADTVFAAGEATSPGDPAIGGYSPVSYFTKNIAEHGSPEFAVEHDGSVYYLTSADQIEVFEKDPDKYRPRHKACSYSLTLGMVKPLDPTNFKIIGDTLLMFHVSDNEDGRQLWNDSTLSEEELLRRADANLFRVTF